MDTLSCTSYGHMFSYTRNAYVDMYACVLRNTCTQCSLLFVTIEAVFAAWIMYGHMNARTHVHVLRTWTHIHVPDMDTCLCVYYSIWVCRYVCMCTYKCIYVVLTYCVYLLAMVLLPGLRMDTCKYSRTICVHVPSTCAHICPLTEEIRLKFFGSRNLTIWSLDLLSGRDSVYTPENLDVNLGTPVKTCSICTGTAKN